MPIMSDIVSDYSNNIAFIISLSFVDGVFKAHLEHNFIY